MADVNLIVTELDGKKVAYSSETVFAVQIGRFKGSYETEYSIKGNLVQAAFLYRGINIGNGYKKRLTMSGKTLAREIS